MPSKARREVIDESVPGAYHVINRVARAEFLLGDDPFRGRDYNHRKARIRLRLELLASIFGVDVLDDALLDTHLHLILRNRPDLVAEWSDRECAERWLRLNRATIDLRPMPKERLIDALVANKKRMRKIRRRLSSISWFMAYLKEPLAREFNREEGLKNVSFWAGRFGCVKLEDQTSLLTCSLYAAMNQLRAGMAASVETSEYTSVHARLMDRMSNDPQRTISGYLAAVHVDGDGYDGAGQGRRASNKGYLELTFDEYVDLVDQLMQRERAERAGNFKHRVPPILERLGIDSESWESAVQLTSRRFTRELEWMATMRADAKRISIRNL